MRNAPGVNSQQQQALNNALSGNALSADDRAALTSLLTDGRVNLTPDQRATLNEILNEDADQLQPFYERTLTVRNNTSEKLHVWVQYRTKAESETWQWLPANPKESGRAVSLSLNPGESADVLDGEAVVSASRVRIWASTASGKEWVKYQDRDFWLVSATGDGKHRYQAVAMESRSISFPLRSTGGTPAVTADNRGR
jgi:hypothetical protein